MEYKAFDQGRGALPLWHDRDSSSTTPVPNASGMVVIRTPLEIEPRIGAVLIQSGLVTIDVLDKHSIRHAQSSAENRAVLGDRREAEVHRE
eukprot:CAMPEP_0119414450 /NCGR_PEP_ID=MMETSP1335-20130426/6987_1 /TAXON_ID=259385 /ORGANISM="Chrysoculter rhomboideus, Strain RCC1486" /LENGTH=90 /DNA_ID=CAMNT_0007439331 /DNA_START=236 /DNA_END=508 /DNA_ORIENTATION=-